LRFFDLHASSGKQPFNCCYSFEAQPRAAPATSAIGTYACTATMEQGTGIRLTPAGS
jgi:hypothetical protein